MRMEKRGEMSAEMNSMSRMRYERGSLEGTLASTSSDVLKRRSVKSDLTTTK
jgi:hypothetical protein